MKKLHDALANLAVEKQDAITAYPAKLGDGSGRVIAGAGLVYVRVADVVAIAACTSVPPVHDLEVWVGYENLQRNVLRVLGQRDALGNRQFIPGVAAHAAMHEFMGAGSLGGTDVVKVQLQQFMPLAVWPYDGLKVIVWPGVVWINGQYKLIADLNQYDKPVPKIIDFGEYAGPAANKEMYYLVGIDNTGNIQVVAGNQVDWGTLALTDIPSAPTNMLYPLAAVRRSFEQAGIVINRESSDIVDLRFPIAHKHRSEDITSGTISANRLPLFTATEPGAVPAPGTVSNKVLRDDGTWVSAGTGDMTKAVYDTDNDGVVDAAESAPWSGITGKPSTFPPDAHNHDNLYYTKSELNTSGAGGAVHWNNVTSKPSSFTPSSHTHSGSDITSSVASANSVPWSGVTGKPSTFPPDAHNHNDLYYTKYELNTVNSGAVVDWGNIGSKPASFTPSFHYHAAVDVNSGTFNPARIPNLDASKITSGTFDTARIPNLDASKITAGYFGGTTAIAARVIRTGTQTVPNNAWTAVSFSEATFDDRPSGLSAHWDGGTRLYCQVAGTYYVYGNVMFDLNANGDRMAAIRVNGGQLRVVSNIRATTSSQYTIVNVSGLIKLNVGNYIELVLNQTSGGNLNIVHDTNHPYANALGMARIA